MVKSIIRVVIFGVVTIIVPVLLHYNETHNAKQAVIINQVSINPRNILS